MRKTILGLVMLGVMFASLSLSNVIVHANELVTLPVDDELTQSAVVEVTETSYTNDSILVEVVYMEPGINIESIELEDGTKIGDYNYTLVKLPQTRYMQLSTYFSRVAWITRNGVVSLSLNPKDAVRNEMSQATVAWNYLSSTGNGGMGATQYWKNTASMRAQYFCHFNFVKTKSEWNLEPDLTTTDWWGTISGKCNPVNP